MISRLNRCKYYGISIDGVDVSYVYIRKNACTAWKQVFINESEFEHDKSTNPIQFMGKHHLLSLKQANNAKYKILVIREPLERVVSAYLNQFVSRLDRQTPFHKSVSATIGCDVEDVTFKRFVADYLIKVSPLALDSHLWSQVSHLGKLSFNKVIHIDDLYQETSAMFGSEFADKYFKRKLNATSRLKRYEADGFNLTAKDLFKAYKSKKGLPTVDSFLKDQDTRRILEDFYSDDINFYKTYETIRELSTDLKNTLSSEALANTWLICSNEGTFSLITKSPYFEQCKKSVTDKGATVYSLDDNAGKGIVGKVTFELKLLNLLLKLSPKVIQSSFNSHFKPSWLARNLTRARLLTLESSNKC